MLAPVLCVLLLEAAPGPAYKVGVATRAFTPKDPYNWRGAHTHKLVTTVWYPADAPAAERPQWVGAPDAPLFSAGTAAPDAKPAPGKFPLIVLSHGTGGSSLMMAWLGTVLAAHGYIAAAVNHPGNSALEAYTVPGFTLWWERARDLSAVIDNMLADAAFAGRIDAKRIGAAGFSLGGNTMIEIAGGIAELARYRAFCKSPQADALCKAPPEFPDLLEQFKSMEKGEKLPGEGESRRDRRVRAVFAIAPALGSAFRPDTLAGISIPVEIVSGSADPIVPVTSSAKYLAAHIPGARLILLEGGVAHYTFLATCTAQGHKQFPLLCTDAPGVDRDAIHRKVAQIAVDFFAANLL